MVYNWYSNFEFDQEKSRSNKEKHGIDFDKAQELWLSPHFEFPVKTSGEERWAVIGIITDLFWTAIITKRAGKTRIISVRRSRYEEKQLYQSFKNKEDN
jgi:uncharacterized DUF497 family protein